MGSILQLINHKSSTMCCLDFDSKYIRTGAITLLREDYGYKQIITIDWTPLDASTKDVHLLYQFLKSTKERMNQGHLIYIHWIVKDLVNESLYMGQDFEKLMDLRFEYHIASCS